MPLGDADIASGIFFADFGQPVVFGGVTAMGNFDAPGKDADFGGNAKATDTDYRVMLPVTAFNPMPVTGSRLTVAGVAYQVVRPNPLDDGKIVEFTLRKL